MNHEKFNEFFPMLLLLKLRFTSKQYHEYQDAKWYILNVIGII